MRLPEFLTGISPIRETLAAIGAGEGALANVVAEKNQQVLVGSAGEGLSLWEADYSLPDRAGGDPAGRRAAIRAAMAGGRTLTPAYLRELCVTLGGADYGEVTEDFAHWRVAVDAVTKGRVPADPGPLEKALERLKPAHLEISVTPRGELMAGTGRFSALAGSTLAELRGDDVLRGALSRGAALAGGVMAEVWEHAR